MAEEIDERFSHIGKDPRFKLMSRRSRKVKIDKRFQSMFNDKRFKLKYTVDKRGRPVQTSTNENLRKFYDLSNSEEESETEDSKNAGKKIKKTEKKTQNKLTKKSKLKIDSKEESNGDSSSGIGEEDLEENEKQKSALQDDDSDVSSVSVGDCDVDSEDSDLDDDDREVDLARGRGNELSSSDEEEEEFAFEDEKMDHKWAELDRDAPDATEITPRLAVCNMDWDRIKAADLLVLFNSFKPAGGVIKKINIYLSEFGKQRLAEEDLKGPKELVERSEQEEEDRDQVDGSSYHTEKLRQYQLNRLKYYYAVMECDSKDTANHIYEQCDGTEYESSSTKLDLRFIPDDMEFDEEPKSTVTSMPDALTYKPTLFNCKALNQSHVELTWDETDKKRQEVLMRKFNKDDLEKMDVKDYLAGSSSEDEDPYAGIEVADFLKEATEVKQEEDDTASSKKKKKYDDILSIVRSDKNEKVENSDMEMEITWEPGLKEATEDLVEMKKKKSKMSPWESYLEKSKDKKQKKRKTKKMAEDGKTAGVDFSDDDLPEGVDMNDPYFKEEMDKMDEEMGPSKKQKKKKKRKKTSAETAGDGDQDEAALSLLLMDEDDDKQHFNLRSIQEREKQEKKKKKRNKKKLIEEKTVEDNFKINLDDPRFSAIYDNPHFNIDPSAPEYKATKSMDVLAQEKIKRRDTSNKVAKRKAEEATTNQKVKVAKVKSDHDGFSGDASLASLIKSVKAKTKTVQTKKSKLKT